MTSNEWLRRHAEGLQHISEIGFIISKMSMSCALPNVIDIHKTKTRKFDQKMTHTPFGFVRLLLTQSFIQSQHATSPPSFALVPLQCNSRLHMLKSSAGKQCQKPRIARIMLQPYSCTNCRRIPTINFGLKPLSNC